MIFQVPAINPSELLTGWRSFVAKRDVVFCRTVNPKGLNRVDVFMMSCGTFLKITSSP